MSGRKIRLTLIVILGWFSVSHAQIPISPDARTIKDVQAVQSQFLHRVLTDTYLAQTDRDKQFDKGILDMLKELEACMLLADDHRPTQTLRLQSFQLLRQKCQHPLVGFALGYAEGSSHAKLWLKRAIEQLPKQGYSTFLTMRATKQLALYERKDKEQRLLLHQQVRQLLLDWIDQEPQIFEGSGLDLLMWDLAGALNPLEDKMPEFDSLDEFVAELHVRQVPDWLKFYVKGHAALRKASMIRGGGWASEVREDQWVRIREQLEIARLQLHLAHDTSTIRHEPATDLIDVCMLARSPDFPNDTPRYWFEQAVVRRFDNAETYRSLAFSLMPRWNGSSSKTFDQLQREYLQFAQQCLDTQRFDTNVPYRAVKMARWIGNDPEIEGGYPRLKELGGVKLVTDVLQGYITHEPDPEKRCRYASELLFFSYVFDDPQLGRKADVLLEGQPFYRRLMDRFKDFSYRDRVFTPQDIQLFLAKASPYGGLVEAAIECEKKEQWGEAIRLYEQIKEQAADDPQLTRLARVRSTLAKWREGFESGQWTALTFNQNLDGWHQEHGDWTRIDEHTIQGVADTKGLSLFLDFDLGQRFEIKGKLRFVKQVKPKFYNVGLMRKDTYAYPRVQDGFIFVKDRGSLEKVSSNVPLRVASIPISDELSFEFRIDGEMAWVNVNDEPIYDGIWVTNNFSQNGQWYIGGIYMRFAGTTLQFSDLQVRMIKP